MNEIHYLYLITREDGERYVGVTKYPDKRFREHFQGRGSPYLKGKNFSTEILLQGSLDEIYSLENHYIQKFKCTLNIAKGGIIDNSRTKNWVKGSLHHKTNLTEDDVLKIRDLRASGKNAEYIAPLFNVSKCTVSHICTGKTWKHVGGPITKASPDKYVDGISIENRKLIRKLYLEGLSGPKIKEIINIGLTTIYRYGRDSRYDPINC